MTFADVQQQRLLKQLRQAGDQPVAFAELHASAIAFPAAVVSEPELNGYVIERVYDNGRLVGVRLLHPEAGDTLAAHPRRRRLDGTDSQQPHARRSPQVPTLSGAPA